MSKSNLLQRLNLILDNRTTEKMQKEINIMNGHIGNQKRQYGGGWAKRDALASDGSKKIVNYRKKNPKQ